MCMMIYVYVSGLFGQGKFERLPGPFLGLRFLGRVFNGAGVTILLLSSLLSFLDRRLLYPR